MSATSSAPPSSVPSPSSPSAAKRAVQLLVSIAIGAGMLWFAFRDLPVSAEAQADGVVTFGERLSALYDLIKGIPVGVHLGYFALVVVQFVMRSLRWKLQAEGVSGEKVAVTKALAINAVAFAAVFLFPFRLGEFVRPVLSQRYNIMTASAGLANSAVERILDGLVTSICFAVVLISLGDTALPGYVQNAGILAFAAFGGIALSLVLAVVWRDPSIRFWRFVLGNIHETLADKLVGMLIAFLDGLRCFRTFAAFAAYLGLTVGYWLINGAAMWFLLTGMGLTANGAPITLVIGYFCLSFLIIAVMLPAPPGNLGNFHAFCKESLTLVGVAPGPALAAAIVLHAWQVVSLVVWSGLWLASGQVRLSDVASATRGDAGQAVEKTAET